ncbi:MAG TPA: hypothetical protein VHU18_04135 [Rhizomicrobium sp.]|jgi:hypothetical protein|nr:hypothetical protein [Rhizomicrobium sp.]
MLWLNRYCIVFGYGLRAFVALIGFFAMTDLIGAAHFGYPIWTIPFLAVCYLVGHFLTKFGRQALAR